MRSAGTPILISNGASTSLRRERIGGKEGSHNERWLQELLHRHPSCIPMDQIEPGLSGLVPVCMELPLTSGYLDNLFMTAEGDIVIVEAKLWENPEARRVVVAQALDYATDLFGMDYAALESAVLKADLDRAEKPSSLYDLFSDADTLDEPDLVDAVNINLQNGRIVVLVIGEGIRTDAEALVGGLQSHAGFHFTLALVELAVYGGERNGDLIAVPRTLLKTYMVERGIVRIEDTRTEVIAVQSQAKSATSSARQSITSEQFYEVMRERHPELPDAIKEFLEKLDRIGVYPEFKRSLNIKWDPPNSKTINLGYVLRSGRLWTDAVTWTGTHPSVARPYLEDLAGLVGGEVFVRDTSGSTYVVVGDTAPNIEEVLGRFDDWYAAIERFQECVRNHQAEGEDNE